MKEKKIIALIGSVDFVLKERCVSESTFCESNQYWNWVIKPEGTVLFPNSTSVIFLQSGHKPESLIKDGRREEWDWRFTGDKDLSKLDDNQNKERG